MEESGDTWGCRLEKSGETKDDLMGMKQATINSLEMEGSSKDAQISKFQRVVTKMAATMDKMKMDGGGGAVTNDVKVKLKKANEEAKNYKKLLDESNQKN